MQHTRNYGQWFFLPPPMNGATRPMLYSSSHDCFTRSPRQPRKRILKTCLKLSIPCTVIFTNCFLAISIKIKERLKNTTINLNKQTLILHHKHSLTQLSETKHLGGAPVQRNGHAICKNFGLSPARFFACNKVSPLTNQTTTLRSVSCAPITWLKSYHGHI